MANAQSFDKLNTLKRRSIPYAEYFGDMELTKEQKDKRQALAIILEDIIYIFFDMYYSGLKIGFLNKIRVQQELTYQLYDVLSKRNEKFFETEEQLDKYVTNFVKEMYDSTSTNMVKEPDAYDYTGNEPYWVSEDRAMFVAENEANTLLNGSEYIEAKEKGYTHKIWMAYPDDRVRPTHVIANGAKIPIDAYFDVGAARMLYPKDTTSEFSTGAECPEEVVNCRCSIKYV